MLIVTASKNVCVRFKLESSLLVMVDQHYVDYGLHITWQQIMGAGCHWVASRTCSLEAKPLWTKHEAPKSDALCFNREQTVV